MHSTMIIAVLVTMSVIYTSAAPFFGLLGGGGSVEPSGPQLLAENSANIVKTSATGIIGGGVQGLAGVLKTGANALSGAAGLAGTVIAVPAVGAQLIAEGAESAIGGGGSATIIKETHTVIL